MELSAQIKPRLPELNKQKAQESNLLRLFVPPSGFEPEL